MVIYETVNVYAVVLWTFNLRLFTEEDGFYSGEVPGSGVKESSDFLPIKTESENKCEPNPCHNGGVCEENVNFIDGYKCQCADDFGGITCNGKSLKLCAIHGGFGKFYNKGDKQQFWSLNVKSAWNLSISFKKKNDVSVQIRGYILY